MSESIMNNLFEQDIFDVKNVDDLPAELRVEISKTVGYGINGRIIELFKLAGKELTTAEIIVAYYRLHHKMLTRKDVCTRIHNMKGIIERVQGRKSVYRLVK